MPSKATKSKVDIDNLEIPYLIFEVRTTMLLLLQSAHAASLDGKAHALRARVTPADAGRPLNHRIKSCDGTLGRRQHSNRLIISISDSFSHLFFTISRCTPSG